MSSSSSTIILKPRDVLSGPGGLSIISIILIAVGGGAVLLSVIGVTVYTLHIRKRRRRRTFAPRGKAGESILIKTPSRSISNELFQNGGSQQQIIPSYPHHQNQIVGNINLNQQYPIQNRMGQSNSIYQDNMIPPSAHARIMHNLPSSSSQYSLTSSSGPYPQSTHDEMSTSYSSYSQRAPSYVSSSIGGVGIGMPPLPANSHQQIQLARAQTLAQTIEQQQRSPSIKSIKIPRKPPIVEIDQLPRLPIPAVMQQQREVTSFDLQRSLSPHPANSINESESYTPILDLGTEFEKPSSSIKESKPFEIDNSVLEQSSWLASALDNAFNSENGGGHSFNEPPRKAPQIPKQSHSKKSSTSSSTHKSHHSKKPSRPPPPLSGPPKKHEIPTTGGPVKVTVNYFTPYNRRTLYQQNDEKNQEDMEILQSASKQMNEEQEKDVFDLNASRISIESANRTAALFSSLEPALRSNENSLDLTFDNTFNSSSQQTHETNQNDGSSTLNTSIMESDQSRRSNSSDQYRKRSNEINNHLGETLNELQISNESNKDQLPLSSTTTKSGFASNLKAKLTIARTRSFASMTSNGSKGSPIIPSQSINEKVSNSTTIGESKNSPQLPKLEVFSPALSFQSGGVGNVGGTPNSFGPPTELWNLSTEDIELPQFVQRNSNSMEEEERQTQTQTPTTIGLGLQSSSLNKSLKPNTSIRRKNSNSSSSNSIKSSPKRKSHHRKSSSKIIIQPSSNFSTPAIERNNSISSYGSSIHSHDQNRAFPWSTTNNKRKSVTIKEDHLTRFNDAESPPIGSPDMKYVFEQSSSVQPPQPKWLNLNLNRNIHQQRDSIASSICETILSSDEEEDENQQKDYNEDQNPQDQRIKLLQSIQNRQKAKLASRISKRHSRNSSKQFSRKSSLSREEGGFTSHSAKLSIDVGKKATSSSSSHSNNSHSNHHHVAATKLDINMGEPFSSGYGILTPPLTPFEIKIPLPEVGGDINGNQIPSHARIKPQASPTAEERRAERLSKLRPLSLATNQANSASSHVVSPHLNFTNHRSNTSRGSSAFGMSPSNSYSSTLGLTGINERNNIPSHSPTRPLFNNYNTHSSNKRVSRAGSSTSNTTTERGYGPMGMVYNTGLSTTISQPTTPNTILIGSLPGLPSPVGGGFVNQQQQRLTGGKPSLTIKPSTTLSIGNGGNSPSTMSVQRYSGSSFMSNTSILNRFPSTVQTMN